MAATIEQIREINATVYALRTAIQDLENYSCATKNGSRNNILDQRDRDTVCIVIDAAAARKQAQLDKILAEVTITVEGV